MQKKLILLIILFLVGTTLSGCKNEKEASEAASKIIEDAPYQEVDFGSSNGKAQEVEFTGEKGETVMIVNGEVSIESSSIETGKAKYFNTTMPGGKTVYFFVVKDKDGKFRAAANGCQVCHNAKMGFRQEGNNMICNTCGNAYPIEKIATEKGGCNPGPINPNLAVRGGNIIINQSDIAQVADLF